MSVETALFQSTLVITSSLILSELDRWVVVYDSFTDPEWVGVVMYFVYCTLWYSFLSEIIIVLGGFYISTSRKCKSPSIYLETAIFSTNCVFYYVYITIKNISVHFVGLTSIEDLPQSCFGVSFSETLNTSDVRSIFPSTCFSSGLYFILDFLPLLIGVALVGFSLRYKLITCSTTVEEPPWEQKPNIKNRCYLQEVERQNRNLNRQLSKPP